MFIMSRSGGKWTTSWWIEYDGGQREDRKEKNLIKKILKFAF